MGLREHFDLGCVEIVVAIAIDTEVKARERCGVRARCRVSSVNCRAIANTGVTGSPCMWVRGSFGTPIDGAIAASGDPTVVRTRDAELRSGAVEWRSYFDRVTATNKCAQRKGEGAWPILKGRGNG